MSNPDVPDRLNNDPATEYAVYLPDSDSYIENGEWQVLTFPTAARARSMGENFYQNPPFEVHSRLNYAVTPWREVEQQ